MYLWYTYQPYLTIPFGYLCFPASNSNLPVVWNILALLLGLMEKNTKKGKSCAGSIEYIPIVSEYYMQPSIWPDNDYSTSLTASSILSTQDRKTRNKPIDKQQKSLYCKCGEWLLQFFFYNFEKYNLFKFVYLYLNNNCLLII